MTLSEKIIAGAKVPSTVFTILKNLSTQRSFLQKNIQPLLYKAQQENDGSLDASDFKKITSYYGLAVPAILGEAFCSLHNKKMTEVERRASTSQGAMTGLFDDFFDKQFLSTKNIEDILQGKNETYKRSNEKLFIQFYKNALEFVPDKTKMLDLLMDVYQAQLESKKQSLETISEQEIKTITFQKGGTSLLFYRSAFLPIPSVEEIKLIYDLGSLMQLSNDIFDVYKDRENSIRTLITEAKHIDPLRQLLHKQVSLCFDHAYKMAFPKKNVTKFLNTLSLGIFSRAFVCLDQLEKNELTTNNIFSVKDYSRKQLICDMDKVTNMIRSAVYHIKLYR